MRNIVVLSFITLDGVMQAPGGPEEDPSGGFKYGGWVAPFFYESDAAADAMMQKQLQPAELLLGRETYDIFAAYWPDHGDFWPAINEVRKYVMSNSVTENNTKWNNVEFLSGVDDIINLKTRQHMAPAGPDIQVHGSGKLVQTLLRHDLVDELWLKIFPVVLGHGKKLFGEGTIPAAFKLTESFIAPNGVIYANYRRDGAVRTGTVGV